MIEVDEGTELPVQCLNDSWDCWLNMTGKN